MNSIIQWFRGGENFHYHNLIHCMDHDYIMIVLVIAACIGVFTGYMMIARKWSEAARAAPDSEAKKALTDLKWIFIFCALCGYMWVVMEVLWPAWRLYFIFLIALNFFTWRYVLRSIRGLEKVYTYLKDRDQLIREIMTQKNEIQDLQRRLSQTSH
ncbi:MAG: hypothetical protein L6Q57_04070 [Alphaproteobacteria bacterium]|nr:hypothetical protein [Alphaproteobacteria bacterium]